jgi:hypothetical protein
VNSSRPPRYPADRRPKERPLHPTRHVWTLRRGSDTRICEVHEDKAHQGWDVQTFDNGWLSYARLVSTQEEAHQLAATLRDDCIREGWDPVPR